MVKVGIVGSQPIEQNKYGTARHLVNAAITAGGLTGTYYLTKKAARNMTKLVKAPAENITSKGVSKGLKGFSKLKIVDTKLGKFFAKIGEKIFNSNNKLYGNFISKLEKYTQDFMKWDAKDILKAKQGGALLLAAGVAGVAFIVNGIYQAGKINAE